MGKETLEPTESACMLTDGQHRQLDEEGFVVLPGILSGADCDLWSRTLDELWSRQSFYPDYVAEPGVQLCENPFRYTTLFEACVSHPLVIQGVRAVLGPQVVLDIVNGRRADPGHGLQPIHDVRRPRGAPFERCSSIWCLDEFTRSNGSTRFIPGSHLTGEPFLSRMQDPLLPHPDQIQLEAPRGAVVIFNSHLLHAGSTNETLSPRRSLQATFTRAGRKQGYDFGTLPPEILAQFRPESLRMLGVAL